MSGTSDSGMREAKLHFTLSADVTSVHATVDVTGGQQGVQVIVAMVNGHVDEARRSRIGAALSALAMECLECAPAGDAATPWCDA